MKLNDGKPWFSRWMVFAYRPITEEGRLVVSAAVALVGICGVALFLLDFQSPWLEMLFAIAFVAVISANVIAYWKLEDDF